MEWRLAWSAPVSAAAFGLQRGPVHGVCDAVALEDFGVPREDHFGDCRVVQVADFRNAVGHHVIFLHGVEQGEGGFISDRIRKILWMECEQVREKRELPLKPGLILAHCGSLLREFGEVARKPCGFFTSEQPASRFDEVIEV